MATDFDYGALWAGAMSKFHLGRGDCDNQAAATYLREQIEPRLQALTARAEAAETEVARMRENTQAALVWFNNGEPALARRLLEQALGDAQ